MHHASYAEPRLLQPASSNEADGYVIAGFTPQDAPDIPRAFTAVYGRDYLSPVVYSPDAFAALIASGAQIRSEEHTSELQPLMRISHAVICLNKKRPTLHQHKHNRNDKHMSLTNRQT